MRQHNDKVEKSRCGKNDAKRRYAVWLGRNYMIIYEIREERNI